MTKNLENKVLVAVERIKTAASLNSLYIANSGGKDSTVVLHIARLLFPDLPVVHNPKDFVDKDGREFLYAQALKAGYILTVIPLDKMPGWLAANSLNCQIDGTRLSEYTRVEKSNDLIADGVSVSRKGMTETIDCGIFNSAMCFPIYDWEDTDVFEYIVANNLSISKEYSTDPVYLNAIHQAKPIPAIEYIIVAPHPDDELIGCYSLLRDRKVGAVVYVKSEDLHKDRMEELKVAAAFYGFTPHVLDLDALPLFLANYGAASPQTVYRCLFPNIKDGHPLHKKVNMVGKCISFQANVSVGYYSVDMNITKRVLTLAEQSDKKYALLGLYPSQKQYIEDHAECWLFEGITDSDMLSTVHITTQFEGFHCYPNAPDEVGFLRSTHRHIFKVRAEISVVHDDREVEFIILKRAIDRFIASPNEGLNTRSCEQICRDIITFLFINYPSRDLYSVTVEEDGENGATLTFSSK